MQAARPDAHPGFHWSVRTRILAVILTVTAIGLAVAGLTAYLVQRERIAQEVDAKLLHAVESARSITLGQLSESDGTADPPPVPKFDSPEAALEAILARVLPDRNESSLGMVDGVPRFRSAADVLFHITDELALVDRIVREVADGSTRLGTYEGEIGTIRSIADPLEVTGVDTTGVFVSAFKLDAELGEITTAFRTYTWVALGTLVAVGLVGWFVSGRLLKPLRRLRETASRITASDLTERIPVSGNDDLSRLTITVNEMLDRMTTLVDDIEQLAGSESFRFELESVRVRDLIEQIFLKCQALSENDWRLASSIVHMDTRARIDPARITQAILQLADNAAKYSTRGFNDHTRR